MGWHGTQERKQNYVANRARVGQNHGEPIDPDAFAAGGRQAIGKGSDVIFIHLMRLCVALFAQGKLRFKAAALLARIVQFGKGVSDFHARAKISKRSTNSGSSGLFLDSGETSTG